MQKEQKANYAHGRWQMDYDVTMLYTKRQSNLDVKLIENKERNKA